MHHTKYCRGLLMVTHALMFHHHCLIPLQCFFVSTCFITTGFEACTSTKFVQCEGRGYFHFSSLFFIFQAVKNGYHIGPSK